MAHVKKYTKDNMQGLSIHLERKTRNHSNKEIDVSRSHLNYDLCQIQGDVLSRLNNRLDQVYCMKRKDVKACCEWIVTLPQELKNKNSEEQRKFFEATYDFLANRYGVKNVVAANVHVDETTPHMHFNFVPVVYDKKKKREKVSAKEVLTRKELTVFHQELDDFLKQEIPNIYQKGILNNDTIGIDDVKILKKHIDNIKDKESVLLSKEIEIDEQYTALIDFNNYVNEIDDFKQDIQKSKALLSNQYKLSQEQFEWIEKKLKYSKLEFLNHNNFKQTISKLEYDNARLIQNNNHLIDENKELKNINKDKDKIIKKLKDDNHVLQLLLEWYERFMSEVSKIKNPKETIEKYAKYINNQNKQKKNKIR